MVKKLWKLPIKFAWAIWVWIRGGFQLLPKEFIQIRYEVCKSCPEYRKGWIRKFCNLCKCTIGLFRNPFNKLAHPCEECPIRNWTKIWGYYNCPGRKPKNEVE